MTDEEAIPPQGPNAPVPPNLPFEPKSLNFVWEMGLRKIRDQIDMFHALDSKTGVVVGFIVVSIVEILGFLILAAAEAYQDGQLHHSAALSRTVVVIFIIGVSCSILSTWLGLLAIRVQEFALGVNYERMVELANLNESELKTVFLDDLLQSIKSNETVLDGKVNFAKWSGYFVVGGLVCYTIVLGMLFSSFVPRS